MNMFSIKTQNMPASTKSALPQFNMLQSRRPVRITPSAIIKPVAAAVVENTDLITPKKMKWGPSIWFFFHTMAEKVKPEFFLQIKTQLLGIIYEVCINLPCPDCAAHAKAYMNGINFNVINTREDLKYMLFKFHNEVNAKKGLPIFTLEELDSKYKNASTGNIIQYFMKTFNNKHRNVRMIADDFHRSRVSDKINKWLSENIKYFYE